MIIQGLQPRRIGASNLPLFINIHPPGFCTLRSFIPMRTLARSDHKYATVAERIEKMIESGIMKVGDKLLSVRALSTEQGISLSTAFQAYYLLESKGLIEARPQSGYYVKFTPKHFPALPTISEPQEDAVPVTIDDMIAEVSKAFAVKNIQNFSLASPAISLLPAAKLNKSVVQALRDSPTNCLHYDDTQGNPLLRNQIARQSFNWGGVCKEEDIVVTAGCLEAISFCLRAVTKPGDAVAIESPTYFAFFQIIQNLGLNVVEIPADPTTGIDLDYLQDAIQRLSIKACLFVPLVLLQFHHHLDALCVLLPAQLVFLYHHSEDGFSTRLFQSQR